MPKDCEQRSYSTDLATTTDDLDYELLRLEAYALAVEGLGTAAVAKELDVSEALVRQWRKSDFDRESIQRLSAEISASMVPRILRSFRHHLDTLDRASAELQGADETQIKAVEAGIKAAKVVMDMAKSVMDGVHKHEAEKTKREAISTGQAGGYRDIIQILQSQPIPDGPDILDVPDVPDDSGEGGGDGDIASLGPGEELATDSVPGRDDS